jgi:hypothetical protein
MAVAGQGRMNTRFNAPSPGHPSRRHPHLPHHPASPTPHLAPRPAGPHAHWLSCTRPAAHPVHAHYHHGQRISHLSGAPAQRCPNCGGPGAPPHRARVMLPSQPSVLHKAGGPYHAPPTPHWCTCLGSRCVHVVTSTPAASAHCSATSPASMPAGASGLSPQPLLLLPPPPPTHPPHPLDQSGDLSGPAAAESTAPATQQP